jgi:RNA polymerase sigma-70 factor (ECF subfamily)
MPDLEDASHKPTESHPEEGAATDEDLMVRFRDRDDMGAFESLVHRYEKPLFNYLFRYLRNAELAEEAFQNAFARIHEKRELYTQERKFRPWLYSIATNQAVDELRREGRHHAASLDQQRTESESGAVSLLDLLQAATPSPLEQLESEERRTWTRQAVDSLPEHLRVVVLLIYFQGLKYREAAEALEIPVGTVKSRLNTALAMLNEAWRSGRAPR